MKRYALVGMLLAAGLAQAAEVEWTRFSGTVKAISLKASSVTIQNKDGDLFTIPVDYQVKVIENKTIKRLADLNLDDKITLIRTPADKPKDEPIEDLVPYKGR